MILIQTSNNKQTVTFPIQIHIHCISNSIEFCINTNQDASDRIQTQFRDENLSQRQFKLNIHTHKYQTTITDCPSSHNDPNYLSCLQSITQQSTNEIYSYHLYLIDSKEYKPWTVSSERSAWIAVGNNKS